MRHCLAADEQIGSRLARTEGARDEAAGPDAAGRAANALAQRDEILLRRTGLGQGAGEDGEVGQQPGVEPVDIEGEVEIDHARGLEIVEQHAGFAQRGGFGRHELVLPR